MNSSPCSKRGGERRGRLPEPTRPAVCGHPATGSRLWAMASGVGVSWQPARRLLRANVGVVVPSRGRFHDLSALRLRSGTTRQLRTERSRHGTTPRVLLHLPVLISSRVEYRPKESHPRTDNGSWRLAAGCGQAGFSFDVAGGERLTGGSISREKPLRCRPVVLHARCQTVQIRDGVAWTRPSW